MDLNNGKKWMKNEYYIEIECRMVILMWVFEKLSKIEKVDFNAKIDWNFYINLCECFNI